MFQFAHQSWFLGFIGLALMVIYYFMSSALMEKKLKKSFGKMFPFFTARYSFFKKTAKFSFIVIALAFMIIALARPQMGKGKRQISSQGVELMVAVDVSKSMLSEDVKPSRLEHAKKEISHLLNILGGDKVGILAFAGSAVLLSPMTTDKSALKMFLETLSPNSVETQGTELAKAMLEAKEAFKRGGQEMGPNETMTRVVILISDGEDHEEGAIKVAQELAKEGIRVFTMAFGSERGGKIPKRDARGYLKSYVRDKSGKEVITKVNHEMMKQIARGGKGSFYHVTFGGSQMKRLKEDLDKLEKSEFDSLSSESFDERYQLPLFFGFLFALIELFIGTRKRTLGKWSGRFSSKAMVLLFALVLPIKHAKASNNLNDIWRNNRATTHMQQKKMLEAHEEFTELLSEKPFHPLFQYNMGTSFVGIEELEKSIQMFNEVLKLNPLPPEVEFATYYNLGVLNSLEGGDIEKALEFYQKALAMQPTSKEIKINIELLLAGGKGGGKGDKKDKKDQKDQGENGEDGEQPKEPQEFTNKQQPNQFDGKEMSKGDVKKILEELKKQEQRIRAKHDRKGGKEVDREKNW